MAEFAETAALLDVMNEDYYSARRRIEGFYDGELHEFAQQVAKLGRLIGAERKLRGYEVDEAPIEFTTTGGGDPS